MTQVNPTDKELCKWLREHSSGIYRNSALGADRIEELSSDLKELETRREVERLINDCDNLIELHYVNDEYFIYDGFSYTTQGPFTLTELREKLREMM